MEEYKVEYATLLQRIKAVFIDMLVIVFLIVVFSNFIDTFGDVSETTTKIMLISLFLYDPICKSIFGGTLGHFIIGIRIKQIKNQQKNIILPLALVRYIFKTLLGWISLITVTSNNNRQAIHDIFSGSIVRLK